MALKMDTDQVMAFDYFTQLCSVVETVSLSHLDLSSAARVRKVNQQLQDVAAK